MLETNINTEISQEDGPLPGDGNNQNIDNQLPINTVGNILSEDFMHRAAQQAISVINRTDDFEHELFSLPFHIQNFDWTQFCSSHPEDIQMVGSNFEQDLADDQILLSETKSYHDKTRVIISDPNHVIPHISDADVFEFRTNSIKQVNKKAVMIVQKKGNMGILTYLSFLPGKKIYGLFISSEPNNIKQFYHVGCVGTEEIIPNISLPSHMVPRDLTSILTEEDKIVIANSSTRFRKKAEGLTTLHIALDFFNNLIDQTIDSAYINKLLVLNKKLSFPNN